MRTFDYREDHGNDDFWFACILGTASDDTLSFLADSLGSMVLRRIVAHEIKRRASL